MIYSNKNLLSAKFIQLLLITSLLFSCSSSNNEWKSDFVALQKKLVPDLRVEVFEYSETDSTLIFKTNSKQHSEIILQFIKTHQLNASVSLLPDSKLEDKIYGIVILSVGNIRTKPGHSQEMATQTLMGTPLTILEKKGGWYRIQTPDNYIGWTEDDTFIRVNEEELNDWVKNEKLIFTDNYGLLRATNEENSDVISDITGGNIFKKVSQTKTHTQVELADKRTGWIESKYLTPILAWKENNKPSANELLKTAQRFMGVPYLWGGTSFKGVDCSGFTKMTYFTHGIQLPRDASQQVNVGKVIETDTTLINLQPGDLLFFGDHATDTKPAKVTHVGIYMGNGKMIHSSGRVRIESLKRGEPTFTEYRLKTFLAARRMLTSDGKDGVVPVKNLNLY
jgi:gamma-D-glutamyl-L-lysine dipeptidyl-peptidase